MEQEFKLYTKLNNLNSYILQYVASNIPNVYRHMRINLLNELYGLIREMYQASYTKGNVRMKNLIDMMVSISMIDMLLHDLVILCPSNKKHLTVAVSFLTEVKNITYSWKTNEEKH